MNELEAALANKANNDQLDLYLDHTPTAQVRKDMEEIIRRAAISTDAGALRQKILEALEDRHD